VGLVEQLQHPFRAKPPQCSLHLKIVRDCVFVVYIRDFEFMDHARNLRDGDISEVDWALKVGFHHSECARELRHDVEDKGCGYVCVFDYEGQLGGWWVKCFMRRIGGRGSKIQ